MELKLQVVREQELKEEQALKFKCDRALDEVKANPQTLIIGYARPFATDKRFILAAAVPGRG